MEENTQADPASTPSGEISNMPEKTRRINQNSNAVNLNGIGRSTRPNDRLGPVSSTDFEGATPKIGEILALRSENMTNKVNYDQFCESYACAL